MSSSTDTKIELKNVELKAILVEICHRLNGEITEEKLMQLGFTGDTKYALECLKLMMSLQNRT